MRRKSIHRRHNRDGSITKTTTYRHKNIFGHTVSDSYSTRYTPKPKKNILTNKYVLLVIGILFAFGFVLGFVEAILNSFNEVIIMVLSVAAVPVGALLYVLISKRNRREEEQRTSEYWQCDICHSYNANSETVCECGSRRFAKIKQNRIDINEEK